VKRSRPVSLALVGLFVWQTGCTSFYHIPPATVVDYDEVEVRLYDGSKVKLVEPSFDGDSIRGLAKPNRRECCRGGDTQPQGETEAIRAYSLTTQVAELGVVRVSKGKTAALVTPFFVVGVLVAIVAITCEPESQSGYSISVC